MRMSPRVGEHPTDPITTFACSCASSEVLSSGKSGSAGVPPTSARPPAEHANVTNGSEEHPTDPTHDIRMSQCASSNSAAKAVSQLTKLPTRKYSVSRWIRVWSASVRSSGHLSSPLAATTTPAAVH